MTTKITSKNTQIFECKKCIFNCSKKGDYNRHLLTRKHQLATTTTEITSKNTSNNFLCNCGKTYKERTALWRHKKKCSFEETKEGTKLEEKKETTEEITEEITEDIDYKLLLLKMMEQNNELQNTIVNQQQEYQKSQQEYQNTIKEMIPKIGNNNTITTTNNNNNNQFNLQMFLNEDCKNALNIKDFVNSLQLSIKDLTDTGKLGYVDGISRIFVNALNDMDVTERPIHCTDLKRETVYIKDADKWEKEGSENTKLKKTIRDIENKNIRMIPKWQEENPECRIMDTRQADEFMEISINALGGNEEKEKSAKKIVKNVLKEVTIDK